MVIADPVHGRCQILPGRRVRDRVHVDNMPYISFGVNGSRHARRLSNGVYRNPSSATGEARRTGCGKEAGAQAVGAADANRRSSPLQRIERRT
jgi:hypothetical protein